MIRINELCRMFSVSKPTVYKWMRQGMKSHLVGGVRLFEVKDVEEFIKNDIPRSKATDSNG